MRLCARGPAALVALWAVLLPAPLACQTSGGAARGATAPGGSSPISADPPGVVLSRFVAALDAGRWADAQALLSARWRAAYTPARLAADYRGAGPLAGEAAAHVRSALSAGAEPTIGDGRATLPVAGGRAVLVAEAAGWRVDALE